MKKTAKLLICLAACFVVITVISATSATEQTSNSPIPEPDNAKSEAADSKFEAAVELIKRYETLHLPKHWPLVGYGHLVLPGERFNRKKTLSEDEADALLRKDLLKNCAYFSKYGADSLLLGVLAYNIGSGTVKKSSIVRKLDAGNRDIKATYLSYANYRGRKHKGLQQRRIEEFELLYETTVPQDETASMIPIAATAEKNLNYITF